MNFSVLPPETNSARIFAGAGSGPMLAAAQAWDELATELSLAVSSFGSTTSGLAAGAWQGQASVAMTAAAGPYMGWLTTAAAQAEQAAGQARTVVGAFESARAATVHPVAISVNRAQVVSLVASNLLGLNAPAIAAAEAAYEQMWAQDVVAMVGYHAAASTVASALTPFAQPLQNLAGLPAQLLGAYAASPATSANPVAASPAAVAATAANAAGIQITSTPGNIQIRLNTPAIPLLPPLNIPPIIAGPFSTPTITTPPINLPTLTVAPTTLPAVHIPLNNNLVALQPLPLTGPAYIDLGPISLGGGTSPGVTVSGFTINPLTISGFQFPNLTMPGVNIPSTTIAELNIPTTPAAAVGAAAAAAASAGIHVTPTAAGTQFVLATPAIPVLPPINIAPVVAGPFTTPTITFPSITLPTITVQPTTAPLVHIPMPNNITALQSTGGTPFIDIGPINLPGGSTPTMTVGGFTLNPVAISGFVLPGLTVRSINIPSMPIVAFNIP